MEWAEIKRRLVKEGTSVQVLADLEGIPYKTMYNRIMAHQVKDGVTYLTPENTKGMKKAKAISDTKQKQAKEKEKAAGLPEDAEEAGKVVAVMEAVQGGEMVEIRPEVYSSAALMPETMDEIERNIEACLQLAARYRQQAKDWKRIRQAFQLSFEGRKLPEVQCYGKTDY